MIFQIDTGAPVYEPAVKSRGIDGEISYRNRGTDAERTHRQIIEALEGFDSPDELDAHYAAESLIIDSLWMDYPQYATAIDDAYEEHRMHLTGEYKSVRQISAQAETAPGGTGQSNAPNGQIDKGKPMNAFNNFDSGPGGSEGPWLAWSARGSNDNAVPAKSFYLRDKDSKGPFDMSKGIVMDVDNMKTGWCYSAGVVGQAPDWKWNPDINSFMQKPGDDYKKGLQVRCAIGGGNTATWEDSGAGSWNGFLGLVPALQEGPGDGRLPLVRMTGSKDEKYARGSTSIPTLEVVEWVARPDCLKEGAAAGIATEPAPAQQQAAPAAAQAGRDPF